MERKKHGRIAYYPGRWPLGRKRPTLVFIHSSGCSARMWEHQVMGLDDSVDTVALDLPGHGDSEGPGMDRIADYAAAVAEWIEEMDLFMPIPCGLSIGGAIVLQLLLDHETTVAGGVLMGTGARLRVMPAIFEAIETDYPGFVTMIGDVAFSPAVKPERIQKACDLMSACPPEVAAGDFRACDGFDTMARLGEIHRPVLIISGGDDRLTPAKYSDYLAQHIPGAMRVHLENTGHMMPLERPDAVNGAIRNFLDSLKSRETS